MSEVVKVFPANSTPASPPSPLGPWQAAQIWLKIAWSASILGDLSAVGSTRVRAGASAVGRRPLEARGLKLEMVAEGVEEEFQLRYLQELNCPVIQGFYYSQAVPCEEARQLIKDGASIIGSKPLQNNESHKSSFAGKNKLKATAG